MNTAPEMTNAAQSIYYAFLAAKINGGLDPKRHSPALTPTPPRLHTKRRPGFEHAQSARLIRRAFV